eukprot:TRINITY_DN2474_c0_g1_i1.p1 TRINITY_DN2474_c0_g1~~TRINITY_DN2474_c0_g1_i1.p1  ORF type:complete len:415 (-),score=38.56 TRINITY_DN2474_c0_g1_i1:93-1337(-)
MESCEEVVIVGAGIAGLATAVALKRIGVRSLVLERSHELRATGAALSLFPNAWRALDALGVAHKLTPIYHPLQKGYFTNVDNGAVQEVSFGVTPNTDVLGVRAVHRSALLESLAEELPAGTIRFSSKLASIKKETFENSSITVLHMEDGTVIKAKVLIGCDGVHSVVAQWLGLIAPVHSGRSAVRGLAIFPEGHGFNHEVQQFLGEGKRAGMVPLTDKEIYWFMTYESGPTWEEIARDPKLIQKDVMENSAKDFPAKYLEVIAHSDLATLSWAPLLFRVPWDLIFGHMCKGSVTVAGDAMHPMTPDLGQGGCAALEDAVVLGRNIGNSLDRNGNIGLGKIAEGIEKYTKERRWRVAGLITGAYLSGWIQQGASGWFMKFFRDQIFYKFIFSKILNAVNYDCGKLPCGYGLPTGT